ncbi:MAG: hypothetical protein NW226_13920 [Microscillaceae bacterium]|nr:hypothetical protein [Microscillaceae bacterium]
MKAIFLKILFWVLMAIIPLIAILLIFLGINDYYEISQLNIKGKVGKARITRAEVEDDTEGSDTHYLYYQVEGSDKITEEVVEEKIYVKYKPGSTVAVFYVPDQPHIARLKERGLSYQAAIFRLGIGIVLLILFGWYIIQLYWGKNP